MAIREKYTPRKVRRRGIQDGRGWSWKFFPFETKPSPVIPAAEQMEPVAYETEIIKMGATLLSDLDVKWKEIDRKLKPEFCHSKVALDNAKLNMDEETEDLQYEERKYDKAAEQLNSFDPPIISKPVEIFILCVLGLTEIIMNYKIFSILGLSLTETWIAAFGMCILLTLSGVFVGILLKKENRTLMLKILTTILVIATLFVLIGIAIFRTELFEHFEEAKIFGINLTPEKTSILFIGMNLLLLILSVLTTIYSTHKNPSKYKKAKNEYKTAKSNLEIASKEYENAVKQYEAAKINFESKKHIRMKNHEILYSKALEIIEDTEWYISMYRSANLKARSDGIVPPCFKKDNHDLQVPGSLQPDNLDWECTDFNEN